MTAVMNCSPGFSIANTSLIEPGWCQIMAVRPVAKPSMICRKPSFGVLGGATGSLVRSPA
jgi:hypothetical protein